MIRSMTAFAAGERSTEWGLLGCELRAVNHRFLELGVRLPDELRVLEPQLRERVATRVSRGKLDLVLRLRSANGSDALQVNEALVAKLGDLARQLACTGTSRNCAWSSPTCCSSPACCRRVASMSRPAARGAGVARCGAGRLRRRARARRRQAGRGHRRARDRDRRDRRRGAHAGAADPRRPAHQAEARLADLSQPADPGRVEQELVLWLQKLDVDEELDRLDSHLSELRRTLKQKEPVGRRLDFLLQEFNREANTLGSKSVDARTSNAAVELKVLIDQIREQIQNIE
jgi:uncharacterized protein YicC (UPF0701 family)